MDARDLAPAGAQPGDSTISRCVQRLHKLQRLFYIDSTLQELEHAGVRSPLVSHFQGERRRLVGELGIQS